MKDLTRKQEEWLERSMDLVSDGIHRVLMGTLDSMKEEDGFVKSVEIRLEVEGMIEGLFRKAIVGGVK
jgi:hypothetical protein